MVQQFGVGVIEHPTAAAPQFMDGRGRIVLRTTRGTPPNAHRAAFLIVADHKAPITLGRTPTPTQKARWKAIQQARLKGAVPAGHRQGTRHRTRHRAQVRLPNNRPPISSAPRNAPS